MPTLFLAPIDCSKNSSTDEGKILTFDGTPLFWSVEHPGGMELAGDRQLWLHYPLPHLRRDRNRLVNSRSRQSEFDGGRWGSKTWVLRLNRYRVRGLLPVPLLAWTRWQGVFAIEKKRIFPSLPIGEVNTVGKPNYRVGGDISMLCAAPVNQMLNLLSDLSFSLYLSFPFFEAI